MAPCKQTSQPPKPAKNNHELPALFEDLRGYLPQAEISPVELGELSAMMDQLRIGPDDAQALAFVVEYLPDMAPALGVLAAHPAKLRPAINLLSTLLDRRFYDRTSGTVAISGTLASRRASARSPR